jgi:uncharacterized protein YjiS (DUF1127 family)
MQSGANQMPNSLVQGSVPGQAAGTRAPSRQSNQSTPANSWVHKIGRWIAQQRQRRALQELAKLDNHLLKDLGLSQDDALREAAKPFWKR